MDKQIEQLMKEKEELERRIALLTKNRIVMNNVKLDTINGVGEQHGKWAVSYKYDHIVRAGRNGLIEKRRKWVPLFCCDNREEAIKMIPRVIGELKELYDMTIEA